MIRQVLTFAAAITIAFTLCHCGTGGSSQPKLAPGQYEWNPERSSSGPLLVVVSIDDQMAYVYRNGVQIARSTVSTGRPGKETPTGVFTILQRKVEHESSIYKGAQMPYMQRLTWDGIAMHAGDLPGYPASGGCIRLPYAFSQKIYGEMRHGSTVVITRKRSNPSRSSRPANILMASRAAGESNKAIPDPEGRTIWNPGKASSGPVSILVSYADRRAYVWRNGVQIGQAPLGISAGAKPPEGVFMMLEGQEPDDPRFPGLKMHPWNTLSLNGGNTRGNAVSTMRSQLSLPEDFRKKVNRILTPGTILLATSDSSNASTRSKGNMNIMVPQNKP
ncbi:MAG: L,D-transpeptidase family protein [Verrucomicrobiota bacterium]